jgi:hypothetical protein
MDDVLASTGRRAGSSSSGGEAMSVIGWIVLGLIAGFIASRIVNNPGVGFFLDIVFDRRAY